MAIAPQDLRLLATPRFRRLVEARVVGQAAHNAMLYTLLILVVQGSSSSLKSTLLVICFTLPPIIVGIPAGTIADLVPRRFILTLSYLLRAVICAALFYYHDDLAQIYLLAAAIATVGQFHGPAESSVVPALVRREQLPHANSLMVFSLILGQIAGMVVLAPLLIKLIDPRAVFVASGVLFLAATYVIGWMASGFTKGEDAKPPAIGFMEATRQGFRILRENRHAYLAIVYLTTATAISKVIVILLPKYTRDVLHISTENAVFVAAPAAIGAGLGLLLASPLIRWVGAWRVVGAGFIIFLLALAGLGSVVYVRDFIESNVNLGIGFVEREVGVSSVITVSMLLAIPIGFAFTLVQVASRVVMNEQAPPEAQGRVFALQMALGDFISLLPLLLVGVAADFAGVRATLLVAVAATMLAAGYLTFSRRFGPPTPGPPTPGPPPDALLEPGR